jgi:hypothetical protein
VTKAVVCFALIGGSVGSLSVMSGSAISAEGFITIVGAISVSCVIGAVLIEGHERDHAAWPKLDCRKFVCRRKLNFYDARRQSYVRSSSKREASSEQQQP